MERRNQRGNAPYINGRPGGKKKETTLMIVCILLVLNMVFMLMLEMQVRNINSALKQVLNRLTVTQMTGNEAEIQKEEEEPIYEDNEISVSNEFDVEIDESGTYTVEVTGKKAKGSVSFIVEDNQ